MTDRRRWPILRGTSASREGAAIEHEVEIARPFSRNRFTQGLVVLYGVVFAIAGISPSDRSDWLLENLVVFAFAAGLVATHRRFVLSNFSSLLVFLFLSLHALGAHYTYSLAPPGFWIQEAFGLTRNHYDRVVHLAFGLLLGYPLREIARRRLHLRGAWSYAGPVIAVLALSSSYELLESWAARIVDPDLGTAFMGTQGDEWDTQKDMSLALGGALAAMALCAVYRARSGREPWSILAPR